MICLIPTPNLMGKTGFLLPLLVVVLLPTFEATLSADSTTNITTDQLALLALKSHVTHDPRNLLATNWSTTTSVCNWIGVTCGSKHYRVTALNFSGMGLTGTIQPHLGNLSFLAWLDIGNNNFHGPLPVELANLRRLKYLNFGNNSFSGQIPTAIGNLSNLKELYLDNNQLSGEIPSTIEKFTALIRLNLSINYLTGKMPSIIGNLTSLEYLDLFNNNLTGIIPSVIRCMTSLTLLHLSNNNLKGNLSKLESLDLSSNKLQGRIPAQLVNLDFLGILNLSSNNLKGLIPQSNHFDTFTSDSYGGNLGLCGFPLSKECGNNQDLKPPPTKFDDTRRELNWKFSILMGYGCGVVFGLSMGYTVFTTGKPWWFIQIIERVQQKYIGRKIRRNGGRK